MEESAESIVAKHDLPDYGGRVAMFIKVDLARQTIYLHTDTVYNPVDAYHNCLVELGQCVEDSTFAWMYREENDEGDIRYVINHYQIADGKLTFTKRYTAFGVEDSPDCQDLLSLNRM
ncbi:hypothetical protein QNI16_19610 [Cytophagaceae bacterium YF14B1]|uniref:Uncharacterized protein n=1 Tax=Xanthocytophaga flava TaxID=3048013 RepID=A0AAE3U8J0_9BACT|nr:hypothetical protein [Xanthocytophaga flavus]MDJ1482717.1 hypothetical protein [Xanthocytophaga flavus]